MLATLKLRFFDWLFLKLFGEADIDLNVSVGESDILILEAVIRTKRGEFAFPVAHLPIPEKGSGFIIDAVEAANSIEAGVIDLVGTILPKDEPETT